MWIIKPCTLQLAFCFHTPKLFVQSFFFWKGIWTWNSTLDCPTLVARIDWIQLQKPEMHVCLDGASFLCKMLVLKQWHFIDTLTKRKKIRENIFQIFCVYFLEVFLKNILWCLFSFKHFTEKLVNIKYFIVNFQTYFIYWKIFSTYEVP
jgi:hypothetical protein